MSDLTPAEREAMEAAMLSGAADGTLGESCWLAARAYYAAEHAEDIEAVVGARDVGSFKEGQKQVEDRIRVLEDALKQIAGRRRLNPAPGYEHVPLVAVEMARIANDAVRRAALSTSVGSSDAARVYETGAGQCDVTPAK